MPRVTVKGLAAENKLLRNEIIELEVELHTRRERSRSRHRKVDFKVEPISARTMLALDIVCKHDRDHVVDEQKKTITKQAQDIERWKQDIERLKRGEGLVKPALMAAFDFPGNDASCNTTETMQEYVKRLWGESNNISTGILFGHRDR